MFDIITFGSASQDILVKPKQLTSLKYEKASTINEVCFPMGSKIDVEDIEFNSGGGGTNTAATFALQGLKTAFCGTIGTDLAGSQVVGELKYLKVNTSLVRTTNKKKTNHSVVIINTGIDRTILAYRGAAEMMDNKDIPWGKLKTKWLYLAPLSGKLCDNFEQLVNFAFERKIKIAANPGMAQLSLSNFADIAKKIDVLFLNQEEASFLTKIPVENEKEIFEKLDALHPAITVMTRGGEGAVVSDGKNVYSAQPPASRMIVDTTGAGDSLASGFLSEYIKSGNIETALQLGIGNSIGCLSQIGAKTGLLKKGQSFEKVLVVRDQIA